MAAGVVLTCVLPVGAEASAVPPPQSTGACYGGLTPAPTQAEPNLLDYKFKCDSRIISYTIAVTRNPLDFGSIDDFSTTATVVGSDGSTVVPSEAWACEGQIPSNGFNCDVATANTFMSAWSYAEGSFDMTNPYCPAGAQARAARHRNHQTPPPVPKQPEPIVQLIVTTSWGAEDGPFRLGGIRCVTPPRHHHHRHGHH
jgi:hypothetical protein